MIDQLMQALNSMGNAPISGQPTNWKPPASILPPGSGFATGGPTGAPGYGSATLEGPNPIIESNFRHLFNQGQIDKWGSGTPHMNYVMGADGKVTVTPYDWRKPNNPIAPRNPTAPTKPPASNATDMITNPRTGVSRTRAQWEALGDIFGHTGRMGGSNDALAPNSPGTAPNQPLAPPAPGLPSSRRFNDGG